MPHFRDLILNPVIRFLLPFLWLGCALVPVPTRSPHTGVAPPGVCAEFFASLDRQIEKAEVIDPGVFRVKGYPYLRANRFIASFREDVEDKTAFAAWMDRMQTLDQTARRFEIANLPVEETAASSPSGQSRDHYREVVACGDLLRAADLEGNENRKKLRNGISAPDDYIPLRRVLGLYPLTRLLVLQGISNWHAEARKSFSLEPPVGRQTIRYFPAESERESVIRQTVKPTRRDALGIPIYSSGERAVLFRKWAPVWEIKDQGRFDHIGAPNWTAQGSLDVDTGQPRTYTLLSFTRFEEKILTQLNYIIWFPARPKEDSLDIYGGFLDGLNYRVTLATDGEPLLYETMHNCGCYYKAYPAKRLQVRARIDYAEQPLIFKAPEINPDKHLMTVAMASRTHFVQHIYASTREPEGEKTVYSLADYDRLRSLPFSKKRRKSMFSESAVVPASERLERFILWPTGVFSPGAMRQWGRHAVAFVGRRHFDDPFYMEKMFREADAR